MAPWRTLARSMQPTSTAARWLPPGAFQDQVVVVTGGGTGLGLELSRGFAALGATVVIASRSAEHHTALLDEARARGWRVEAHSLDVREEPLVRAFFDELVARHGRLDVLVNNAAGNFVCPAERMSANAWRAVLGIVLDGTFYCSKHAARHMRRRGSGAMLNVIATYAWTGMAGVAHSASAKAGVLAFSKSVAVEWASHGIRVNTIAPGPFTSDGAKANLWPSDAVEARIRESVPMKRFAERDEVAAQGLWLCSDACRYVTGANLTIDGGLSLGGGRMWEPGERRERAGGSEHTLDAGHGGPVSAGEPGGTLE
jgi:NAD(P)-dependent dehydrogenase (short-subunit alcohol dehydrogenase family)